MTLTIDIDETTRKRLVSEAALAGKSLEDYAATLLGQASPISQKGNVPRRLGWAAGRGIWIADDFDEPLEEFKDYM